MDFNGINGSTYNETQIKQNDMYRQQLAAFTQQFGQQSETFLGFQQGIIKVAFDTWKKLTQTQIDSVINFYQLVMEQGLSARERLDIITEYQLKRLHEISMFEQGLALDAAEIFQAQSGAMHEQVTGVWQSTTNPSNK